MRTFLISSVLALATFCSVGAASACIFDADFSKCFNQCTEAGYILAPACALGSTPGIN